MTPMLTHPNFIPLRHMAVLQIAGPDAEKFLQGQTTCDVRLVHDTHGSLGAFCDNKGRMIANFFVWREASTYYLLLPTTLRDTTLSHLRKYGVFSKVTIEPEENVQLGEWLGSAAEIPKKIRSIPFPRDSHLILDPFPPPLAGEATPGEEAWRTRNVQTGLVWIYPETSGSLTPQMINLGKWDGISFKKGCYVGQEIVARTEHLGQLKRHLYRAHLDEPTAVKIGDPLTSSSSQSIGMIVELAREKNGLSLLAVIHDSALQIGAPIFCGSQPLTDITRLNSSD